jgi:hypothetical protein
MFKKKKNTVLKIVLIVIAAAALLLAVYYIPPIHERLSWRLANLQAKIFYFFNPPGENAFTPGQQAEMEAIVNQTMTAIVSEPTATLRPSLTPTNYIPPTATVTPSPTPSPTPIPDAVRLQGVVHEFQKFNNCGPANLAMDLSFWGWEGDQTVTAAWLKPNQEDRNVMPYEMVDYVDTQTDLNIVLRYGGDLETIQKFVAAGFPVLIERGFEEEVEQGVWMGHYALITAYDDDKGWFLVQDSYVGADYAASYDLIEKHWQEFNYLYMVIYPDDLQEKVMSLLGQEADETENLRHAAQKALDETTTFTDRKAFFAWYNYGVSLRHLGDYFGAAQAFDTAFSVRNDAYEGFNPYWRITWYQTDPYFAYFNTNRFQDVIDLANDTLNNSYVPAIEETWVWRGRAKVQLGDIDGAIEDFREALKWHPDWWVAEAELEALGVTP